MRIDLAERIALVTGSTTGIGYAIARVLHDAGATVVMHGRTDENVRRAADAQGVSLRRVTVAGDLGTREGCEEVCRAVEEAVPRVDILVNNAGIYPRHPARTIPYEEWERVWRVNALSGAILTQRFTPEMRARGEGRVIFVASESGVHIPADMIHYGTSKLAQMGIANGWARELAGTGVTVNSVLPGPTDAAANAATLAAMVADGRAESPEHGREIISASRPPSLLKRWTTPEEVAGVVLFLASPLGAVVTGHALDASGGMVGTVLP